MASWSALENMLRSMWPGMKAKKKAAMKAALRPKAALAIRNTGMTVIMPQNAVEKTRE